MKTLACAVPSHRNLSLKTRCRLVIGRIYSGATTQQLEKEFGRKLSTLLNTCRTQHYSDTPKGQKAYETLREKLHANDRLAKQTSNSVSTNAKQAEKTTEQTKKATEKSVPASKVEKPPVFLVETGTLLTIKLDQLFQLSKDTIIYVPRFCIEELDKMSRDDVRAKSVIMGMYAPNVFQKRIFPLANIPPEQNLIPQSSNSTYKRRTIGIVNAALNLALTGSKKVQVFTTSREVTVLLREIISKEHLDDLLTFTYVAHPRKSSSQPGQPTAAKG